MSWPAPSPRDRVDDALVWHRFWNPTHQLDTTYRVTPPAPPPPDDWVARMETNFRLDRIARNQDLARRDRRRDRWSEKLRRDVDPVAYRDRYDYRSRR